jgi:hypothetical protein
VLVLAWLTASRMADMTALRRSNIVVTDAGDIFVDWRGTKTGQLDPFQPQLYTHVAVPAAHSHLRPHFPHLLQYLRQLRPNSEVCPSATRQALQRALQSVGLTEHSVKRSALTTAATRAAETGLPLAVVSLLGKHKTPQSTIRYIDDPVVVAKLAGTGALTRLL